MLSKWSSTIFSVFMPSRCCLMVLELFVNAYSRLSQRFSIRFFIWFEVCLFSRNTCFMFWDGCPLLFHCYSRAFLAFQCFFYVLSNAGLFNMFLYLSNASSSCFSCLSMLLYAFQCVSILVDVFCSMPFDVFNFLQCFFNPFRCI